MADQPYVSRHLGQISRLVLTLGAIILMTAIPFGQWLTVKAVTSEHDSASQMMVLIAQSDARVAQTLPDSNFGSSSTLRANGGSDTQVASYLRFVVLDLHSSIERAVVQVYATSKSERGIALSTTSDIWDEMQITWNNRPAPTAMVADRGDIVADTWVEYPVTSIVTGTGSYSFVLTAISTDGAHFSSREGEHPPRLVLTMAPEATETPTLVPTLTPTTKPTRIPEPVPDVERVHASVETEPVPHANDAADDAAIWIHPTDTGLSTIIGTDKQGGLAVYDLSGKQLQYVPGLFNNVDLRQGFILGDDSVALVATSNRETRSLAFFRVNPQTRLLEDITARPIATATLFGACLFRSSVTNRLYFFGTRKSDGLVEQWYLFDTGAGLVDAQLVRTFSLGAETEACVGDDLEGAFYISEEAAGIWKYGAEPDQGEARTLVATTGSEGHLVADVEGLAIASDLKGGGYLIASSQGNDTFVVYDRAAPHVFVKKFAIVAGPDTDGVSETDGIEVSTAALGPAFPHGLFVAQDGNNDGSNQNFKLVPWDRIMNMTQSP